MPEPIDLLSGIAGKSGLESSGAPKRGKFEASILTTYNVYLPFYEDVILRRLVSSGCQHNILLADADNLSRSLSAATCRPRLAGRAYTLVPMKAAGAFHPKVALLVGKKRVRVFVGSHNATLSGFGHNRELTTQVDLDKGAEDPNAPLAQAIWSFLEAWLDHQEDRLPPSLLDAVRRVAMSLAPWLRQPAAQAGDVRFVGATPEGDSLWQRVRPFLPGQVERVTVLGPFFDREGSFLATLSRELKPRSIAVGIEPEKVALCRLENMPDEFRFHDATGLGEPSGYLHAKAILIEGANDEAVLITGSANPSHPAWTAEPSRRNAEAVVLHRGAMVRQLAQELGMSEVSSLPALDGAVLATLCQRPADAPDAPDGSSCRIILAAEARAEGLFLPCAGITTDQVEVAYVTCRGQSDSIEVTKLADDNFGLQLLLTPEQTSAAAYVEVHLAGGRILIAFVHHPAAIARLARTSSQQRLRDALDSLDSESPDLPTVIRLANSLIFDGEDLAKPTTKKPASTGKSDDEPGSEVKLGPLSVPVAETRRQQKRIRELRGGDLAYVIDVLIYRLGLGLSEAAEQLEDHEPTEEEQVGAEEDQRPIRLRLPPIDLAKTCQSKIRTLVSRMVKQFDKADAKAPDAHKPVEQLLAVLAVLREVRAQDRRLVQLTGGESLVPVEQRNRLLEGCVRALFGRKKRLFDAAARLYEDDPNNDLSRLLGLLIWLAWDSGLDLTSTRLASTWDTEARRQSWIEVAKLLEIATRTRDHMDALNEARHSVWRTCDHSSRGGANLWITRFEAWTGSLTDLLAARASWLRDRLPKPGDLAIAEKENAPKLRVVLSATGKTVRLAEFGENRGEVVFDHAFVKTAAMPSLQ